MQQDPSGAWTGLAPRQVDVLELLRAQPGSSIAQVAAALGLSHTAASHRLRGLRERGLVEARRHGRTVRHSLAGAGSLPDRLAPLLRDGRARIVEALRAAPRVSSINHLAQRTGLSFRVTKAALAELAELGLVRLEHQQGRYRVHPAPERPGLRQPD